MQTIIRLEAIEKQFDGEVVIHPLDLSIYEGEFLTLLGPSGCGKTTLLRMVAGFEQPTSGEIYLDGIPQKGKAPYERDMNMVFQQYALFPHMNVEDNILFGLKIKNVPKAEQEKRLIEVLSYTKLANFRKRRPAQLSGGQQQRVAIARAIINRPKVLLLDEPLGALDYQLRKSLQLDLKNLQKTLGITFVYVTHDQEEALMMSDRIVIVNEGKIEQIGSPQDIYRSPKTTFAAKFIGENNFFQQGDLRFCVRPEDITIELANKNERSDNDLQKHLLHKKQGLVQEIVFTGNVHKIYVVPKDEADKKIIVYDYHKGKTSWQKNDEVVLSWSQEDEVMLN
ncbi:ABC transporter ATP-binding protein [Desulfuribacillus alkaliarsenatis]|uniref:Spermidine/putrescine ABC transporter ATP-binding protein n=1 Tax=Desulfuribacillus alkaliarsenatis TaxID=766136 RepID=A0A1E5G345_9FIRM|nr:ABC transporter ATP-binding protein [Desulfuribacillus alkaliarsenatis]OEF97496.1 spermidine/putrescine ABC transporter ATP-binding protein [Desulfuribacillus alkaliarsenatis]